MFCVQVELLVQVSDDLFKDVGLSTGDDSVAPEHGIARHRVAIDLGDRQLEALDLHLHKALVKVLQKLQNLVFEGTHHVAFLYRKDYGACQMMIDLPAVKAIFNLCAVEVTQNNRNMTTLVITPLTGEGVSFRYADMPRIAVALGTEHINFRHTSDSKQTDTDSFVDFVRLEILAYVEPPR